MGNRGLLHDDQGRIKKNHQLKRWIICLLEFKGWWREVMKPGHYTELFFWDEATALAAGHRPCAECQRERYTMFRDAWTQGRGAREWIRADELDAVLHGERIAEDGTKAVFEADPRGLPDGTMFAREAQPHLIWEERLWPWTSTGYGAPLALDALGGTVSVLTPRSSVGALECGFPVEVRLP